MSEKQLAADHRFLPAALSLEKTPASAASRLLMWSIMLLFVSGLAWAAIGQLDIVVVARGKVIPSGYSKPVESMIMGRVMVIDVSEGQPVKQGQRLLQLDDEALMSEQRRLLDETRQHKQELAGTQSLLALLDLQQADKLSQHTDRAALEPRQLDSLALARWHEFTATRQSLENNLEQLHKEQQTLRHEAAMYDELLPMMIEQAEQDKQLATQKLLAKRDFLQTEQQRIQQHYKQQTVQSRLAEKQAATRAAEQRLAQYVSAFQRQLYERRQQLQQQVQAQEQALYRLELSLEQHRLTAPIDGVVQQLQVRSIGEVVSPAQTLMMIVPTTHPLEVEAMVENRDIGFMHAGQHVEIKVDAFPYTRYGVIAGRIRFLAPEAVIDEQNVARYPVIIELDQQQISVNGEQRQLTAGMAVSAETKTGQRRVMDYFLGNLRRVSEESIRER